MTLGSDIKAAIEETGQAFSLYRDGVLLSSSEYIWLKSNSQVTKPFIREFFLEAQVPYDSAAKSGDLVLLAVSGERYLVMHVTPDSFENSIYRNSIVLYKANVSVSVVRPVVSRDTDYTYLAKTHWNIIAENLYVTFTSPLYGHELNYDSPVGPVSTEEHEMYVPSSYGVQSMDIIRLSDSFFEVKTVKKRRYVGVDVLELGEDTHSETTTTTTTTTAP